MKRIILIVVALSLFVACENKPKNPVSEYGDALIDSYNKGKQAGETANLDAVKKTIQAYRVMHDKYPQNLDEIKSMLSRDIDFSKYEYNPENGAVNIRSN